MAAIGTLKKYLVAALEVTCFAPFALKLVRMYVLIKYRMRYNVGHWGHKLGQLVKLTKYVVATLEVTFLSRFT